jgi:hypothetical protein
MSLNAQRPRRTAAKAVDLAEVHECIWSAIMDLMTQHLDNVDLRSLFGARQ